MRKNSHKGPNHTSPRADSIVPAILSFGYALWELQEKHKALSAEGFEVRSISDFQAICAVIAIEGQRFSSFVIGPAVPQYERDVLTKLYRQYCPRGTVIFFYKGSIKDADGATILLSEHGSPGNLLEAIGTLRSKEKEKVFSRQR